MIPTLASGEFLGSAVCRTTLGSFTVTESTYAEGAVLPRHAHARDHLCFVLAGTYGERLAGRDLVRRPMSLSFQASGVEHREEHGSAGRHLLVELDLPMVAPEDGARRPAASVLDGTRAVGLACRLHVELRRDEPESRLAAEELLHGLVDVARDSQPTGETPPAWLARVDEFLRSRPDRTPTLAEVADAVGVHRSHLARVYVACKRRTVGDELRRIRVARAAELLGSTRLALAEVGLQAGFADQAHFCKVFKRALGVSPGQFRRAVR